MNSFMYGTSSLWAVGIATVTALLLAAYPFVARLQPSRRSSRADGLNIIHNLDKPQFEIVAVHGLGAHPDHTWEGKKDQAKVHLLRNLLPEAFPTARILSFSYNSDWLVDAPEKTAQQVGHGLAEELAKHRAGALRLPIIFIGHSFGGIVIKEALCAPNLSPNTLADTCGIIFLGTPHQGSSLSIAGALLSKLTVFLGSNTTLLLALQSNQSQLSDLEVKFRLVAAKKQILVKSFYETKSTFFWGLSVGLIVNRDSATGYSKDPVGIDTNHAGLNKFNGPDHAGFRDIKAAIDEFRAKPLIEQADDFLLNEHYNSEKLKIKRLSREELSMDQCYINLSIVEQVQRDRPSRDELEAKDSAPKSSPFSLLARLRAETTAEHSQVSLEDLFSRRRGSNGMEISPRRVLIRGRAGVGKTTLCKKMVHSFVRSGMWRDLYDRVLWVPLRNLKRRIATASGYNLERLFFDEFFRSKGDKLGMLYAEETSKALKDSRTLFVLDGWDEVDRIADSDSDISHFLRGLLHQPNVIITSRPSASIPIPDQLPIDLELETIGFNPTQVDEYIEKAHARRNPSTVVQIKTFLQSHELVRSLVRIPIQLDAFCYCWGDTNHANINQVETMTALYQAIQTSLWKKDIRRLEKKHDGERIVARDLKAAGQFSVERHIKDEASFLEYLAFTGLVADTLEFDQDMINKCANSSGSDLMPDKTLPSLSFLRSSDPSAKPDDQSYHFIHLTFQEYFAARHFVHHWNRRHKPLKQNLLSQQNQENVNPVDFLNKHKYDAPYNIMWRFVAGLLDEEKNASEFFGQIEQEPIDMLGPTHQRLVMHCLNEALDLPTELRKQMEKRLLQWVLFERDFTTSSTFARESELPEWVLYSALTSSGKKKAFLAALQGSQRQLSDTTMAALVELFKDEDSDVRRSAARALGKQSTLSDTTMAALMELFKHEKSYVRDSAAKALGKQSTLSDTTMAALVELFKDENWSVRESAASALGKQSMLSDTTMAALMELFKHEKSYVRDSAAKALGKQSTLSDTTMAALVELFKDENWSVRESAASALGKQSMLSDTTMAALVELLKDEIWRVRDSAASALGKQSTLSDTTMAALVELLKNEDSNVRDSAARALGNQSTLSDTTMAALVERFKDEDSYVRVCAAKALGKQSTISDTTMAALIELFKDEDWMVRYSAAEALGNQSTLPDTTMTALMELFKDEDSDARSCAAEALGKQSTLSDTTMTALVELLKDKNSNVRDSAARALGNQSTLSDTAMAALVELLKHEKSYVRDSAAEALGNQSTLSDITMAALVERFKDEDSNVRRSAAEAIGKQSTLPDTTMAALIVLLKDEDSDVQHAAAEALGNQSTLSDTAMAALMELIKDEDSNVQISAALTLGNRSTLSDTAMAALVELFKDENIYVRRSAASALGKQLTLSDTTMAALVELLKDEDSYVRRSAASALGNHSTLSDTAMAALVERFKDEDSNVRESAASAIGKQSTLPDTTMAALIELLKNEEAAVRRSADEAICNQSTLSDKILNALGLTVQPNERTQSGLCKFRHSRDVEAFYDSFLHRSFNEHFSLYVTGDVCVINQASGLRTATLEDQSQFQVAIRRAQSKLENTNCSGLWTTLGRQNEDKIKI